MALSAEFREHLTDLFAGVGPVAVKRMFGGAGLYLDDACFALVVDQQIMMRGDDDLGPDFESAGSEQWVYENAKRGPVAMPYWRLPESALDDPDEAARWAERSLIPARKAAAEKAAAKARKSARAAEKSKPEG